MLLALPNIIIGHSQQLSQLDVPKAFAGGFAKVIANWAYSAF